jgi:hypothetical protein
MSLTDQAAETEQDRAHTAVRLLRQRLAELGLPDDQIRQILPVSDIGRRAYVRMGTLTVDSAETILTALGAPSEASQ